jgi:hypothetical protein
MRRRKRMEMVHVLTKRRLRIRYVSASMMSMFEMEVSEGKGAIQYYNAKSRGCVTKATLGCRTITKGGAIGLVVADFGVCCSLCNSCSNPSCHSCESSKPEDLQKHLLM